MKTYDLGYCDRLNSTDTGFTIEGLVESWVCVDTQVPLLVAALRDLGHITDEPELLSWYTVERHGRPKNGPQYLFWRRAATPFVSAMPLLAATSAETRYLPLDHLRGHTELPGWDEAAPAPEPELPEPWMAPDAPRDAQAWAYAWALDNEDITVMHGPPQLAHPSVVAWCPITPGQPVPPHPYARAEQ